MRRCIWRATSASRLPVGLQPLQVVCSCDGLGVVWSLGHHTGEHGLGAPRRSITCHLLSFVCH